MCHIICWSYFSVFAKEHSILLSADKTYGDTDIIFYKATRGTNGWFKNWPANLFVVSRIENLWAVVKRKRLDPKSNNADNLKTAFGLPLHLHRATG